MSDLTHNGLRAKYQHLFARSKPGGMRFRIEFGIEVGAGWLHLLDDALAQIADEALLMPGDEQQRFGIWQIKEKFGELRVYYTPRSERIATIVLEAAQRASRTCEGCGGFGISRRFGTLVAVRCRACGLELARDRVRAVLGIPPREEGT